MKLYTFDPAPNPKRLQMFIDYKGIEVESTQVDLMAMEQFEEGFRKVNPASTVPTLVLDDGTILTEVIGACVYLEETYPEKPLMGRNALEKAQVVSWDHRLFNACFTAIAEILRNDNPAFKGRALPGNLEIPQIPDLAERGRLRLGPAWKMVDAALAESPFLAGEHFSLADIDLLVSTEFAGWVKEGIPDNCPALLAWRERVRNSLDAG